MTRYKQRYTDTPSAGQFFGYLLTLSLVATTAYLVWLDWPLVAVFLGARPWLVFWGSVFSLSILAALAIWTALTDKREPDIYSAQDTRRPWEEVE